MMLDRNTLRRRRMLSLATQLTQLAAHEAEVGDRQEATKLGLQAVRCRDAARRMGRHDEMNKGRWHDGYC